jgi:hypothetical protein
MIVIIGAMRQDTRRLQSNAGLADRHASRKISHFCFVRRMRFVTSGRKQFFPIVKCEASLSGESFTFYAENPVFSGHSRYP